MRGRKEKKILILLTVGITVFLSLVWICFKKLEYVFPVTERERAAAVAGNRPLFEETESLQDQKPQGTLKFGKESYDYFHRIESYLFMGTDFSGQNQTESKTYTGDMADFLALLVIDQTDKTYAVLQLNRDTMVNVRLIQKNGKGYAKAKQQLCTAHWYGGNVTHGDLNTVEAVEKLLGGLPVDGYYTLSMKYIPEINAAVDGVTVTISDDFTDSDASLVSGEELTLTDEQAVHFIHDRLNVGDGENTSRMRRQKLYMEGWYEKAVLKLKEDARWANNLYRDFMDMASTDFTGKDVSRIINCLSTYESLGIRSIEGTLKLGKALGDGLEHTEFYPEKESLCDVMKEICSLEKREE